MSDTVTMMKDRESNQTRLHYPGCYRVSLDGGRFGQIKRVGRKWHAEIRRDDGSMLRHAGIWSTLAEAVEEIQALRDRELEAVENKLGARLERYKFYGRWPAVDPKGEWVKYADLEAALNTTE